MANQTSTKKERTYQFEPLLPKSKADIVEKSVGEFVPFPSWMTQKISGKLGGIDVLGLGGPAGSGKKTLLKQASPAPVHEYTVDRLLGLNHVSEFEMDSSKVSKFEIIRLGTRDTGHGTWDTGHF